MKSILAITHDTSLSGAPKSLVLMLEELNKKYSIRVNPEVIYNLSK